MIEASPEAISARIKWAREALGLTKKEIALGLGLAESSYHTREFGTRKDDIIEYVNLALFLNTHWENRFPKSKPKYQNKEVTEITPVWIMLGEDPSLERFKSEIDKITDEFTKREIDQVYKYLELQNQIERQENSSL